MTISATKIEDTRNNIKYVAIANDFYNAVLKINRKIPKEYQKFIAAYNQGNRNCETWYKFLEDTDVILEE